MAATAHSPDPFALLALEPRYELDPAELEQRFFARSRELHPDRFAAAPAAQRVAALTQSRALNDAYHLLRKPSARAEYLLGRHGVTIGGNERLEPAFLQEILELREELAEARVAGKLTEVERLAGAMRARRKACIDELAPLFRQVGPPAGAAPAEAAVLARIKHQLISLRYLDRYLEECDAALDPDSDP